MVRPFVRNRKLIGEEDIDTRVEMDGGTQSRYWLPTKHLIERLNKGPFKTSMAEMFGSTLYLTPLGSTRAVEYETRIQASLLYAHTADKLALAIERSFHKQVSNTRQITERFKRTLESKEVKTYG